MSDKKDGSAARIVTEMLVKLRRQEWEEPLDDRALAREVTLEGFKVETQTVLTNDQLLHFELALSEYSSVSGFARVSFAKQEHMALFATMTIERLPRAEKRKLRRYLFPEQVDWLRVFDAGFTAAFLITTAAALQRLSSRPDLHPWLRENGTLVGAAFVAFTAVVALATRSR